MAEQVEPTQTRMAGTVKPVDIPEVDVYQGRATFYSSQYRQVGQLYDLWADLIEGYGEKGADFFNTFLTILEDRNAWRIEQDWKDLKSTGFFAPKRTVYMVSREPAHIAVLIAKQGADLYISWKEYVQTGISRTRVLTVLGLNILFYTFVNLIFFGSALPQFGYYVYFGSGAPVFYFSFFGVIALILFGVLGLFPPLIFWGRFRRGDWFALLRKPLNEIHLDEVIALAQAVHKSMIAAADKMGIDTSKLLVREPFYSNRQRKPRI